MKHRSLNEDGLIPLLLTILAVVIALIYLAFHRVSSAQH